MYIANYIIAYGGDLMNKSTWRHRRPIIKFVISPSRYRRKQLKKPPDPIQRSKYAQQLFEIGAGWSDE